MVLHRDDVEVIVATLGTAHAAIHHEGVHLAGNVLSANEDGCVVVEERHKVVNAAPLGLLVADEAYCVVLVLLAQLEDAAEGFLSYLKRKDIERYRAIVKKLGLRK